MLRREFRAMGTDVELLLEASGGDEAETALEAAQAGFERLEALLSRFLPDSELSALNRAGALRARPELYQVVELALAARERTGGRFDPTVHDALVAAGYDRSFELVAKEGPAVTLAPRRCGGGVALDRETCSIVLAPGVRLDLGGIGKGFAVDRACAALSEVGPCLVNAGGDVAVSGGPWPVGVETANAMLTLLLTRGGLATSGRDRRRWRRGDEERHHIVDPETGLPAESDLVRVTVVGLSALDAEVTAKALFLAGAVAAGEEADEAGIPCVLVAADGRTLLHGGLR
jgi:thiamine biosynthesis lipoprotein